MMMIKQTTNNYVKKDYKIAQCYFYMMYLIRTFPLEELFYKLFLIPTVHQLGMMI